MLVVQYHSFTLVFPKLYQYRMGRVYAIIRNNRHGDYVASHRLYIGPTAYWHIGANFTMLYDNGYQVGYKYTTSLFLP